MSLKQMSLADFKLFLVFLTKLNTPMSVQDFESLLGYIVWILQKIVLCPCWPHVRHHHLDDTYICQTCRNCVEFTKIKQITCRKCVALRDFLKVACGCLESICFLGITHV